MFKNYHVFCTIFVLTLILGSPVPTLYAAPHVQPQDPVDMDGYRKGESSKVSDDLLRLYEEHEKVQRQGNQQLPENSAFGLPVVDEQWVVIDAAASGDTDALRADLEAAGLQNTATYGRIVSGRLPISAIGNLESLITLQLIRPSAAITRVGLVDSQGDAAMRSDEARAAFGVDGRGITIGSLSDSFDCLGGATSDVANGDLPPGITVLAEIADCSIAIDEGRAMMQLIADVAPGANQAFHSAFNGAADFANGIIELAVVANADIIVDDVGYLTEPFFQDGIIAQAADLVVTQLGVPYFSSAGNSNRNSYESAFSPSGITLFGNPAHDFDPGAGVDIYQQITVPAGSGATISFQWDQPFFSVSGAPGAATDLDILLFDDPPTTVLAASADFNINGDPVEFLTFNNFGPATTFNIVILNFAGPDPTLMKYILFGNETINEFATNSSTSFGHPNAANTEAVGASFYANTPEFGVNPPILEPFSSAGGTPILFDVDGNPIVDVRMKPEIVAPDGTNTTFFFPGVDVETDGFPNFFGTSAAAPHAAAVAGLLLEANPNLTPAQVYEALEQTAIDMLTPGFDFDSGYGFIQADRAIAAVASCVEFHITLDGLQEVPPNNSTAMGAARIQIDTVANTINYHITFSGLQDVTAGHIHGFAPAGENAGVLFNLNAAGATSPLVGTIAYDESQEADILAGLTYINIHSTAFPPGEIRGQIAGMPMACTPPTDDRLLFISTSSSVTINDVRYRDDDILAYDRNTGMWFLVFDGSDVGLQRNDVNAFQVLKDGTILMSFNRSMDTDDDDGFIGPDEIEDTNIYKFIPASLGKNTAGHFELFFEGEDVDLDDSDEDIDALFYDADTNTLLISTLGNIEVEDNGSEIEGKDEDLLLFTATSLGEDTEGTWSFHFDGSDVKLNTSNEDVSGTWTDHGTGELYLTTRGRFKVEGSNGVSFEGGGEDIFICDPISLGDTTDCTFSLFFDGLNAGLNRDIDGFSIGPKPPVIMAASIGADTGSQADEEDEIDDTLYDDVSEFEQNIFLPILIQP